MIIVKEIIPKLSTKFKMMVSHLRKGLQCGALPRLLLLLFTRFYQRKLKLNVYKILLKLCALNNYIVTNFILISFVFCNDDNDLHKMFTHVPDI